MITSSIKVFQQQNNRVVLQADVYRWKNGAGAGGRGTTAQLAITSDIPNL